MRRETRYTTYRIQNRILLLALCLAGLILPQGEGVSWAAFSPGSGFTGPTTEPGPIGTPGEEGYDAKAIARWDVVPYQVFSGTLEIGVVAFHMIGIDRVEFCVEGGPWQAVNQMTLNPRTGVNEYWDTLDANDFSDGPVEVRAIVYPTVGQPRLLDSLRLFANAGGTLENTNKVIYVDPYDGDDLNDGSLTSPMRTITYAIDEFGERTCAGGGKIILLKEGLYELSSTPQRDAFTLYNDRYITVEATAGLNRDNVIIGWPTRQQSRPKVDRMHWKGVSFDFSTISQYYTYGYLWFENCRWFQSDGWDVEYDGQTHPVRSSGSSTYVTDSLAYDTLYGFVGAKLVRNSTTERISGDAYQLSKMVLNSRAVNVDGSVSTWHTDVYQIWGYNENIIVYGLDTQNIVSAQCIFLDHFSSTHTNYAFVDIYFDSFDPDGGPPWTQFNAAHNHVIFRNVRWPGQRITFRDDMDGDRKFTANNVIFENCELYPESFDRYVLGIYTYGRGTPEGVTFKNCYQYQPGEGSAPVLEAIGNKSVSENSLLTIDVNATDPDGDPITYLVQNLPTGAEFAGQTFSWTPNYNQAGSYQVTFIARDNSNAQDSETITITVINVNRPTDISAIPDTLIKYEGQTITTAEIERAQDPDIGDTLTYTYSGWLTSLPYTNTYGDAGTHTLHVDVSDGTDTTGKDITITVINVNRPTDISAIPDTLTKYVSQTITTNEVELAQDPDIGDTLTYTYSGWLTSLPYTITSGDAGTHILHVNVSDGTDITGKDITITVDIDDLPPTVTNCSPQPGSIQVRLNNLITLHIADAGIGVDAKSVKIKVRVNDNPNNDTVYFGDFDHYTSPEGDCRRLGTKADYRFVYQPTSEMFYYDQTVTITVNATDLAGNVMDDYLYSFATEMHSFGQNKQVNSALDNFNSDNPVTVCDNSGNIWAAWHAGQAGSRNIYVGKLAAGADNFDDSFPVRANSADQCNPAIALDSNDKLYVVWQDNRQAGDNQQGEWDIYISTSIDGINWSTETRVNDPNNGNQVNPAIVIDNQSPNQAHVAWQDDRAGNQDICIAASIDSFATKTVSQQITSDSANQIEPAITADSDNTIYVVWTDGRNASDNIYGAASNNWTNNVAIINDANNQSSPAIAAESTGSILHLLWVDDTPGDNDIYYASSNGLPGSPLTGGSIIDEPGTDQLEPTIAVTGSTGNNLKVFACWQDWRNTDTDLYFAELSSGSGTNVFVGDGGSNAAQGEPAIGIDEYDHPYLVWADSRNIDIYYAGCTFMEPSPLASELVTASASSSTILGTNPASITTIDDVSIVVPAGACSYDVKITISKINNLQLFAAPCFGGYDFGPSGIQFDQPVTITIPYAFSGSDGSVTPYWFNALSGTLSQQGITNVQDIVISPTLHALSFETTHFTAFYLLGGGAAVLGGGGGGGGCSISAGSEGNIVEFILPYIGLGIVMAILKMRDARKHKARNMTAGKY